MKQIRTITLNPSFDLHYTVPGFAAGRENLVTAVEVEAGGKGVNTARALSANGVENLAYVVVGKENGASFVDLLRRDGLSCRVFETEGRIRENITIHPKKGTETRISLDTFRLSDAAFDALEKAVLAEPLSDLLISFSGRIPQGVEKERVLTFLRKLTAGGAKLIADSVSLTPDDLGRIRPWFIKPNEQEITAFADLTSTEPTAVAKAARNLVDAGVSEAVMVTLGGLGAVYVDKTHIFLLSVPHMENPPSTIGAGDSVIAGLLAATREGLPMTDALRLASAYGTAACMSIGTRPPRPVDIRAVLPKIRMTKL